MSVALVRPDLVYAWVELNGRLPWLCEATMASPDRLSFTYVYPEVSSPGGGGTGQSGDEDKKDADGLPERALDIRVTYVLDGVQLHVELLTTNRSRETLTFDIGCHIDADFADIQEALAGSRQQDAPIDTSAQEGTLEFTYQHPKLPCRATVIAGGWDVMGSGALCAATRGSLHAAVDIRRPEDRQADRS